MQLTHFFTATKTCPNHNLRIWLHATVVHQTKFGWDISSSLSAPACVRALDLCAIRTLPSVVDDNGGCDFKGPTCDGIGVGSGHMVQYRGRGRGLLFFSCPRLRLSSSFCFLAVSNDSTPSLIFLLQAALSLASCSQDCRFMQACFKEHFSWSLYRSFGLPWGSCPFI